MMQFKALAFNDRGDRFMFTFMTEGWGPNYAPKDAQAKLDCIVAGDPLHQKHGPWKIGRIDIGS